jgi:hypothetical protein
VLHYKHLLNPAVVASNDPLGLLEATTAAVSAATGNGSSDNSACFYCAADSLNCISKVACCACPLSHVPDRSSVWCWYRHGHRLSCETTIAFPNGMNTFSQRTKSRFSGEKRYTSRLRDLVHMLVRLFLSIVDGLSQCQLC